MARSLPLFSSSENRLARSLHSCRFKRSTSPAVSRSQAYELSKIDKILHRLYRHDIYRLYHFFDRPRGRAVGRYTRHRRGHTIYSHQLGNFRQSSVHTREQPRQFGERSRIACCGQKLVSHLSQRFTSRIANNRGDRKSPAIDTIQHKSKQAVGVF